MEVSCLVLLAMFSGTFAASCENMVRLADLHDIIRNQTKLIADLKNAIAFLNTGKVKRSYFILFTTICQIISWNCTSFPDSCRLNSFAISIDLSSNSRYLINSFFPSEIYFMVSMTYDASFVDKEIIKFDKIITNVGGGYIDNVNNADYGRFIAPRNGTYQFKRQSLQ